MTVVGPTSIYGLLTTGIGVYMRAYTRYIPSYFKVGMSNEKEALFFPTYLGIILSNSGLQYKKKTKEESGLSARVPTHSVTLLPVCLLPT